MHGHANTARMPTLLGSVSQPGLHASAPGKPSAGGDSGALETCGVRRLLAAMGKGAAGDDEFITVRDLLRNMEAVKQHAPQLLQDFAKIDRAGSGRISAKQLEEHLAPNEQRRERSRQELQEIWDRLVSGRAEDLPSDRIFLQDLARHFDFAERSLPDLVERFHEVDADRSCSIERNEFDAFFGDGEAWLEAKLAGVIGLEDLKEQIRTFYWSTRLDHMRRRSGAVVHNEEAHVLMFRGNPGVGKTTVARLITGLLHKIGVIPTEDFVEVQRDQLVGDHIGASEQQTQEVIEKARGGVLFVDEAYRLNGDAFGVEVINCLMKAMTEKGSVIVLAGYPKEMDQFVAVNPGIKRRITYEFTFPDYDPSDLAKILEHQVRRRGFQFGADATTERIAAAIRRHVSHAQRAALNGGVGEHACRHAIFSLNRRQIDLVRAAAACDGPEPEPSITLELEDVEFGCRQVPAAPQPSAPASDARPSLAALDAQPQALAHSASIETLAATVGSEAPAAVVAPPLPAAAALAPASHCAVSDPVSMGHQTPFPGIFQF